MKPEEIYKRLRNLLGEELTWSEGPADPHITVSTELWKKTSVLARDDSDLSFKFLRSLSGVDYPNENVIELVAHLFSYKHHHALTLKTRIDRDTAKIESLSDVWPAACWHERETFDLLGVDFIGNPDLRRILLPEDWIGHPLRKDYQQPKSYHSIPTSRSNAVSDKVQQK